MDYILATTSKIDESVSLLVRKYKKNLIVKSVVKLTQLVILLSRQKPLNLAGFFLANSKKFLFPKVLLLNFKRNRFFPSIKVLQGETYVTVSLGLFASFFKKGKFFIKNKSVYLVLASFLRKILMYTQMNELMLFVKRTPVYLQELLATIHNPVINFYKNPFGDDTINESILDIKFYFYYFMFITTKPYGFVKTRKKGRVKRKILKRVISINRLTD